MGRADGFVWEVGVPLYNPKDKARAVNDMARHIFNRTQKIFEYAGLDNDRITFSKRELELLIQMGGCCVIAEHEGKLWALRGTLGGVPNAYYMPTMAIVANPYLGWNATLEISRDCEVIPNDSLYRGLTPLVSKYSSLIVEAELSLDMAAVMTRSQVVITGDNDTARDSAKLFIKHLRDGDLDVVATKAFVDGIRTQPLTSTGATRITDLIEYRQYLWGTFLNELGLKAAYNMKREALSDDEVSVNDLSLTPLIENMLETRQLALEKVNNMFGTEITVRLSGAWEDLREDIDNDLDPGPEETPAEDSETDPEEEGGEDDADPETD